MATKVHQSDVHLKFVGMIAFGRIISLKLQGMLIKRGVSLTFGANHLNAKSSGKL